MEWNYIFDPQNGILEVKVSGQISRLELNEMAKHNLEEIQKLGCYKCLLDYRETTSTLDLLDVFDRPKEISNLGIDIKYKIALLVPPEKLEHYRFNETVYKNNNYAFEIFSERVRAVNFLSKE